MIDMQEAFCAVFLLGVMSIRGRAQESSVSWVERKTDFLGARNSYRASCALFDKQRYRMVRAVDTPDGMFHLGGDADLSSPLSFSIQH